MLKSCTSFDLANALTRVSSLRDACLWHSMIEFSTANRLGSPPPDAHEIFTLVRQEKRARQNRALRQSRNLIAHAISA